MKKALIISAAFVLFFAALGYFIWWQHRSNQTSVQPAQIPQNSSQPFPPAPADTSWRYPDFNFARLSGDSLHLYSIPIKSDSTLEAAVYKDEMDYDYIRLIGKKGEWCQNEDSLWIQKNELIPYFALETPYGHLSYYDVQTPEDIFTFFAKSAFAPLNVLKYYVYNDSFLSKPPVTLKTKRPIRIINRQLDGYSSNGNQFEIFKIVAFKDTSDSVLGWARSEDLIMVDSLEATESKKLFLGTVGFIYHELSADWEHLVYTYLKTSKGFTILGPVEEYSFSPDNRYLFTDTKVVDSLGNLIVNFNEYYCNPTWVDNTLYVRGYTEDDGVYKANLKNRTVIKFIELPDQFTQFSAILPDGDGYTKWPAVTVDNINKVLTILYEREDRNNNQFRFKVRTNYNGKILSVDTTRIYSNEYE